jgi:hypothetical protein
MGFQSPNSYNAPSVFLQLMQENQMNSPVIAFKLTDVGGEMSIGGLDSSAYYYVLSSSPGAAVQGYWSFFFREITVNSVWTIGTWTAIVDAVRLLHSFIFLTNIP